VKVRSLLLSAAFVGLASSAPAQGSSTLAETGRLHPDLAQRAAELDRARGVEAYAALRRVWSSWDRANPADVEEVLREASTDKALTPGARAYAGVLSALGRVRRGDLRTARDRIASLGYVDRWVVIGPFDNEGKAGLDQSYAPELEFTQPIVPGAAESGKERPVRWRVVPREFPHGFMNFGSLMRPEQKICAYATTFVKAKAGTRAPRKLSLWIGTGGAFRAFWNGSEVLESSVYSGHDFDRHATVVNLEAGTNSLTVKVCGDETAPVLSVRLADERGEPDPGLDVTNELAASTAAAELAARLAGPKRAAASKTGAKADTKSKAAAATPEKESAAKEKARPKANGVEGPAQTFDRLTSRKDASAADLEAHAAYLRETDGDDPAVHLARDLAHRAAEKQPTVRRLLLAAALAEDNNQRGEWIKKAEALERTPSREVLLARALHRRASPGFQEAFPLFDRVLARYPDDMTALQGRVELYNMAGLPRTALATLERALERNPRAVNLLNLYASELRALGRTTEAAEAEARYSALRFDDSGFLGQMLELSIARRDKLAAEHWAERLLASHPGDLWALGAAGRAYRSLGENERAIATYKRALDLAPEDVGTLRTLAELYGSLKKTDLAVTLLREILRIRPQEKSVREYVEFLEPKEARPDEGYAWAPERFLPLRHAPAQGENRRTLRDLTVSTVFDNGLSSQYRQLVFQPLTDSAAANARQYGFVYEADRQVVQLRGAKVYRGNGRIDEAIEWGEGPVDDPSIAMYTSGRAFYVQFPRLEAGDVVELRYRVDDVTPRNEFNDYFGDIVYLQGTEPSANVEYVLATPKTRTLYFDHSVPGLEQKTTETQSQRIYRFFAKKVPALDPEPGMPPGQEVLGFVHASTYKSWDDLGRWYWGLVKDQFDLDDETRALAQKIAKGKKTDLDKVKAVYDWVTRNTRYVALEFGIYGYKPRRCVQTVARGWGDCKDKAAVIVTLLNELGIPATFIVVRTQMKGGIRTNIASFAPFDHAIAYVPSLDLYLDGTAEHTGIYELPRMDIGAVVMHVDKGKTKITTIPVPPPDRNFVERIVRARIQKTGEAKLTLDYRAAGYSAADWRRQYQAESARRERMNHDLGGELPGFVIAPGAQGIQTSNLSDPEEPVHVHVEGTAPSFARREGGQLSMAVTNSFRLTSAFATLSQRKQDVSIIAFSELRDTFVVDLPAGIKVVSAPETKNGDSRFGWYSVVVEQQPDKVTVKSRLGLKVTRVVPKDYAAFKAFCAEADRALGARLVVE
jgi:tetratricopeptide (TPR) repeat protein/transglutaminase-like putative cysteine protease